MSSTSSSGAAFSRPSKDETAYDTRGDEESRVRVACAVRATRPRVTDATRVFFFAAWFLIALATQAAMVLAGRAIAGFCVGIASLSLPVYLGETVQPEVRGTLGLMPTTLGNTGILLCYAMGRFLDWDNLAMLGGAIPVPFLISMFLIPETPRWYMSKGEYTKKLSVPGI